jgi:hypothetical protein
MIKKSILLLLLLTVFNGCKSMKDDNPVTRLPKKVNYRYGIDLIENEKIALDFTKLILKNKYKNIDFDNSKYIVKLILDDRVWEIEVVINRTGITGIDKTFFIRINRNTGEVYNLWQIK